MNNKVLGFLILILLQWGMITKRASAQKLPNIQSTSMRIADHIKIEGKANEISNHFVAYNKATNIFYTIANNDDVLYIAIRVTEANIIRKFVIGGLTLTINNTNKHADKGSKSITFPVYDKKNPPLYLALNNRPEITKDTLRNKMVADSFRNVYNVQIARKLTTIGVTGLKEVPDELSIYNEQGIKAASLFDSDIYYTCELAIPLKQLGLDLSSKAKFSYNIKLNGVAVNGSNIQTVSTAHGDMLIYTGANGINYMVGTVTPQTMTLTYSTDFWGEYILVK